jgi:hypothetical protein
MKREKIALMLACAVVIIGGIVYASDHNDASAVKDQVRDITDLGSYRYWKRFACFRS